MNHQPTQRVSLSAAGFSAYCLGTIFGQPSDFLPGPTGSRERVYQRRMLSTSILICPKKEHHPLPWSLFHSGNISSPLPRFSDRAFSHCNDGIRLFRYDFLSGFCLNYYERVMNDILHKFNIIFFSPDGLPWPCSSDELVP